MTDTEREIKRLISYIRSCRVANIDWTVTIERARAWRNIRRIHIHRSGLNVLRGVRGLIRQQAEQIEHKTVAEYIAEKYKMGSVADGQKKIARNDLG